MQRLIALSPILYKNVQYNPGDELPTDDPDYVAAWIACGSAEMQEEEQEETREPKKKAKAKVVTAKAGQTGIAQPSSGADADLVGRVPDPETRGVIKEPSKRQSKPQG